MKRLTIILLGLIVVSGSIIAQTGTIKGIVKDRETGEPVPFASVYVEMGGVKIGDVTDFDGKYTVKPLNSGVHTVHVSYVGYNKVEMSDVEITPGQIAFVNVDVTKNIQLGVVVIERSKYEIPLINQHEPYVQAILPEELKYSPNRLEPIKVVATLPGVKLADNGRDVYIRGARPQSTQFITDGMKSITGSIGIPGQAIGSIKVYTGGVPSQYGDVSGGVIVVETKSYFDLAKQYK